MPQIAFTFDIPEEKDEFNIAFHGIDFGLTLFDFDQWLRSEIKDKDREELQEIRDRLYEIMSEREISLDMII